MTFCFIEKVHAMEKENEIQTANEVKVCYEVTLITGCKGQKCCKCSKKGNTYLTETRLCCMKMFFCVFRKRWRSRSTPTVKLIRNRSAASEMSWTTRRNSSLKCKSKTARPRMSHCSLYCLTCLIVFLQHAFLLAVLALTRR